MREKQDQFEGDLGDAMNWATVLEVDLEKGLVRAEAGDVETDWVRWGGGRAGATRTWSPPSVGEQVMLFAPGGDIASAFAIPGFHSDLHPPAGNSLRELVVFQDGAEIAYDPEAHLLEAKLPDGATVSIVATGGITLDATEGGLTIKGDVSIEGEVHATGDIGSDGDVVAGAISLQQHRHGGVAAGGALTGVPQ
ncbi:phage baseplate assembly protein V [Sphingosinicella sp. CPCC 101087]|uniref:phage baseplate assembly protein V n=1 Tax=Sphingosinicella sp. CPCC 101087 TaxID=2497754 RepID=UPI0013EAD8FE|nr:phage baseplate assembly protein V [Sphingosinicella sp. CPCC 101087]